MSDLLTPDDTRDALRKLGGLLLGLGFLMWWLRKVGPLDGKFSLFLILAVPAAFLYGLGTFTKSETGGLRSWQTVYSVFGLIFIPLALIEFVEMIGDPGDAFKALNIFWIFGVTAALGFYAGLIAGVRFQLLAGSIALIVSWSGLWQKILGDEGIPGHYGIYRGLLGILAIGLLAGAVYLWRENPGDDDGAVDTAATTSGEPGLWKGSELLTGAGIAAVLGAGLGFGAVFQGGSSSLAFVPLPTDALGWDIVLLIVSLGLVGIGSRLGVRGPAYVGGIGLFFFLILAGADVRNGGEGSNDFGTWPLVLMILGALAVGLSAVAQSSQGDKPKQLVEKLRGR
jgi:hypothetical protein